MIVSSFPLYNTATVTVKGTPAIAEDGMLKLRVACGVPQPEDIVARPTIIEGTSHKTSNRRHKLNRDFGHNIIAKDAIDGTARIVFRTFTVSTIASLRCLL